MHKISIVAIALALMVGLSASKCEVNLGGDSDNGKGNDVETTE